MTSDARMTKRRVRFCLRVVVVGALLGHAWTASGEFRLSTVLGPSATPTSFRAEATSGMGIVEVGTLPGFPVPGNAHVVVELGAAGPGFQMGIVPAGGFSVPAFCIPSLGFTSRVIARGCESGGADGAVITWGWDTTSPVPAGKVTHIGDTTDPGGNTCGTLGTGCTTGAGGAGADTRGNVDTVNASVPFPLRGGNIQLDVPVHAITWADAEGACPDLDGAYDPGTDTPVSAFDTILSPTTGETSATFSDLNGDSCAKAGAGPISKSATGVPTDGFCEVGQTLTMATTGIAFTGGAPMYDITYKAITLATVTDCGVPSYGQTCTLTTDPCLY